MSNFTHEFLSGKLIDFKMTGNIPKNLHMMYLILWNSKVKNNNSFLY